MPENSFNSGRLIGGRKVMNEPKWEKKFKDLVKEFSNKPESKNKKLAILAQQADDNHNKLRGSIDNLQKSLDYLRLCIKYQSFDLEATRRENEQLKKLLERKQDND